MKIVLILLLVFLSSLASTDYYQILGLQRGADLETVKKQFRKLSLQYHPDKNQSPKALELYKKITHAYQSIVNEINGKGYKDYFWSGKDNEQTDFEEEFYRWYQEEERRRQDYYSRRKYEEERRRQKFESGRNQDYERQRQYQREEQFEQERRRQEQQRNEEEYFRRKNNERTNNFGDNKNNQQNYQKQKQQEQNQSSSTTILIIIFVVIFFLTSQWWRIFIRKPSKSAQKQPSYLESPQWQQIYQNYE